MVKELLLAERKFGGRRTALLRLWWLLLTVVGCAAREPELDQFEFSIRVESDPGRPLPGASVLGAGEFRAESDALGLIQLRVDGQQGRRLQFQTLCPPGYRSPDWPLEVTLIRLGSEALPPEYRVRCAPEVRSIVIAVRAQNGPGLPVMHLGNEVARTDRSGAAHVVMQATRDEQIELTLDTSSAPRLKPHNPSHRFEPPDVDAVLVFDEIFVADKPPPKPAPWKPVEIKSLYGSF